MINIVTLRKEVTGRLEEVRHHLGLSVAEMSATLNIEPTSYRKQKRGEVFTSNSQMHSLGDPFRISLDWLFLGEGSMLKNPPDAIEKKQEPAESSLPEVVSLTESIDPEYRVLLDDMNKNPLLKHKILVEYYSIKDELAAKSSPGTSTAPVKESPATTSPVTPPKSPIKHKHLRKKKRK